MAFAYGGFMGVFPAITMDNFGPKNQGANYGLVFCGFAIGGIIGPKFTVLVKDIGAVPYSMSYMITAAIAATGLIIAILVRIKKKQR